MMRFVVPINCLIIVVALQVARGESPNPGTVPIVPIPPVPRSPVETFRELLEMKPADRTNALANKSEKARKVIEERLHEFDALPLNQRQTRLRVMQLRWELLPLLSNPATNRPALMALIPEQDRDLVRERLQHWDRLPTEIQSSILTNEAVMHYLITGRAAMVNTVQILPPALQEKALLTNVTRWRQLTADQQRQAFDNFREIFDLGQKEREKLFKENLLIGRSPVDQQRIEQFLKSFEELPPEQREKRMGAFRRFTSMTMEQRLQFLQNSQRWANTAESEREAWRQMLNSAPPVPPLPAAFFRSAATNAAVYPP